MKISKTPLQTTKAISQPIKNFPVTFKIFGLHQAYKRVQKVGDRLSEFESIIEWDQFRPIHEELYRNKKGKGGRPDIDPVVMGKLLVLQELYNFSDPELERQVTDRISFRKFIGFPPWSS